MHKLEKMTELPSMWYTHLLNVYINQISSSVFTLQQRGVHVLGVLRNQKSLSAHSVPGFES